MATQEVGVRAIFETQQFSAGVRRYIRGLQHAAAATNFAVAAFNQLAQGFSGAFQGQTQQVNQVTAALQQMTQAARQAGRASGSAAGAAQSTQSAGLQRDLEVQRLIKAEIKDRISLEKQLAIISNASASTLSQAAARAERDMIGIFRQMRDQQLVDLQLPPDFFDSIRHANTEMQDLGNSVKSQARDVAAEYRLLTEAVRDRVRVEQISLALQDQQISKLERERYLLELQQISLAQLARIRAAQAVGDPTVAARLARIQGTAVEDRDVGQPKLERDLAINRLVNEAYRDRIALARANETIQDKTASDIQRQQARLQATNLLLERQRRLAELVRLGGDPAQLDAANKAKVAAADLNRRANEDLLRQVQIQQLIQAEVQARIELERQSNVLNDRRSTELQRQAALLRLQTLATERNLRTRQLQGLGVSPQQVTTIRQAAVATRDLGNAQQRATAQTRGLTAASAALTAAAVSLVTVGLARATQGLGVMGRSILETVTFFERLELSVGFYAARSKGALDVTEDYETRIAGVAHETQGLLVWLQRLAVASPFTTRDVGNLFRTSQAYGLLREEAEILTPLLLDFAAAAGLDSDILERLALAIGQVRARGKLTGEEIRQLGNSGIPIRDILVETLGIANEEFDELVESGALTSNVVIPAIIKALKQFEGAGEAVAFGTIGGIIAAFDELREIGTAKFFQGALNPLKESFQEFFAVANQPGVLAIIQVLGEEVGTRLAAALTRAREAILGMVQAWNALSPAVKQQIVVFAGALALTLAMAGAFGLMTMAMNLLLNPLVALTLGSAFLVSEWTSGFAAMRAATSGGVRFIANLLVNLADFGGSAISAFAEGIIAGANAIGRAMSYIGRALTFWLAPGSPPNIAPQIDIWGEKTMEEWIGGIQRVDVARGMGPITKQAYDALHRYRPNYRKLGGETMLDYAEGMVDADFVGPLEKGQRRMVRAVGETLGGDEVQKAAGDAAIRVSEAYINGFGYLVRRLQPLIDPELQKALFALGNGPRLTAAGAFAFDQYLSGFAGGDYSILEEASGVVESFLQSLVDRGELEEKDMLAQLFGTRQDIAQAIQEFRRVGRISDSTLDAVAASSWDAGEAVRDLLVAYQDAATAEDAAVAAQKNLKDVTKQYTAALKPLQDRLEAISALRQRSDEDEQIRDLQRVIANEAVSGTRRENAQLQIQEILQQRRVRALEAEQKAATDVAQTTLDAATERQQETASELDLVKQRINSQLEQLGLVDAEAKLMKQLAEEVAKLREKQKTELDLQLELLKLQQAELGDLEKAARAKYVLDQADSSELEKQQAILDLMEVSLARQERLAQARELGIPTEELTKLYDFEVTLDDIGVKTKEDFSALGGELDGLLGGAVDATAEFAKWEAEIRQAREKVDEVKASLGAMFQEINDNLPSWLKIFPEEEGGTPPILKTLDTYKWGILTLGGIILSTKIIGSLAAIAANTVAIDAAITGGGAVGGVAAAAGGGGVLVAIARFTTGLGGLGLAALVVAGQIAALYALMQAFGMMQARAFERNEAAEDVVLGDSAQPVARFSEMFAGIVGGNAEAKSKIADAINDVVVDGIQSGFDEENIAAMVEARLNRAIVEGMIADTPENRGAIQTFADQLLGILQTQGIGGPIADIKVPVVITPETDPEQAAASQEAARQQVGSFLDGIVNEEQKSTFAESITALINDAVGLGMSDAQIQALVFGAFNEGVKAGLVADTPQNRSAIQSYIDGLMTQLKEKAEIQSPSALAAREIGGPLGEGIVQGILAAIVGRGKGSPLLAGALETMVGQVMTAAGGMETRLKLLFGRIYTALTTKSGELRRDVKADYAELASDWKLSAFLLEGVLLTRFTNIKRDGIEQTTALRTDVESQWLALKTNVTTQAEAMKLSVVTAFENMKIGVQTQVSALQTLVTDVFVGGEGQLGLIDLIEATLLGADGQRPVLLGENFMLGIAQGITNQKQSLASALVSGLHDALTEAQTALALTTPATPAGTTPGAFGASALEPVTRYFGSGQQGALSGGVTNITHVRHYHLTVNSAAQSQGVINDFGIMQTLAGG